MKKKERLKFVKRLFKLSKHIEELIADSKEINIGFIRSLKFAIKHIDKCRLRAQKKFNIELDEKGNNDR